MGIVNLLAKSIILSFIPSSILNLFNISMDKIIPVMRPKIKVNFGYTGDQKLKILIKLIPNTLSPMGNLIALS